MNQFDIIHEVYETLMFNLTISTNEYFHLAIIFRRFLKFLDKKIVLQYTVNDGNSQAL